jgi:hypothetical protein
MLIAVVVAGLAAANAPGLDAPRVRRMALPGGGSTEVLWPGRSDANAISGPIVSKPIYPAVRNIDVRELPQVGPIEKDLLLPELEIPGKGERESARDSASFVDPVAQTSQGSEAMPAPLASFAGLDKANWGSGYPPDTNGDVGPVYYIQTVNASIGIYTKATGARVAAFTFNTFFDGTGTPCDTANQGDPIVLYDSAADRWIITDFAWSDLMNGPYYECIAVSQTGNPVTGDWYQYGFVASANYLDDYPKLSVWPDAYYMSVNLFDCLSVTCGSYNWQGVQVYALPRAAMLAGQPITAVSFNLSAASNYGSLLPSNVRGAPPPAGSPNYFVSADQDWSGTDDVLHLWKFHVDWTTPADSTFTGPTDLVTAQFMWPSQTTVPAQDGTLLDTLGDRLMMQLQYRNLNGTESLWVNHTVSSGGVTGVRWYEVRSPNTTPVIFQQGTYQPDSTYRWMGSMAVDGQGNMAVGYSASSSSMYPAIRYAGRLVNDPLGELTQGETTLVAGTGSQMSTSRWGDYSALSVDPVDDCTFWYTTEYYAATGIDWQTRIGSFRFPSCVGATGTLSGTVTNQTNAQPIGGAQVQASNTMQSYQTTTESSGLYSLQVPSGTYTVTVSALGVMQFITTGLTITTNETRMLDIALQIYNVYLPLLLK